MCFADLELLQRSLPCITTYGPRSDKRGLMAKHFLDIYDMWKTKFLRVILEVDDVNVFIYM